MAETTGSAAFANLDWSKFDFTRWSLSGLGLDTTSSTVATLLQKVMAAPQWPQSLGSNLPALKTAVIDHLTSQVETLGANSTQLDQELATRSAATQNQITALQGKIRQSSVPPTLTADPNQFQVVAKAVDQQSQLGLPGLTVQLSDPADPNTSVASGTTDSSGNAILSLPKQNNANLESGKTIELTVTILNSEGKSLYTAADAMSARANQVETHIAAIPSTADTADALQIAVQLNARDTTQLNSLTAKLGQLKVIYAGRKTALQTQITQIKATIAAIQAELKAP
jgi:hypothetical protein